MDGARGFADDEDPDRLFSVNIDVELERLTQRIAWTAEFRLDLSQRPELRRVRSTVADRLNFGRSEQEPMGGLLLVVDELVANAYVHATNPGELRVTRQSRGILVEVTDDQADAGDLGPESCRDTHGLRLVGHLSLEWGVRPEQAGKVVWALVPVQTYYET
ncbi:PAS/PAC sensor protein [Amycolatopsis sp. MJM2582]|uniref:ATP-binding protein n=1 Tax=unclassified Amycolatopsis TaxID=2618356 RepID=UPI0005059CC2|nr:ATP-binding protein [Amycolatopsis sp. MJM2582]KFZ80348.1 PAS/PAC sensor protein [Amycolatopsis sp. MJM2582]